MTFTWLQVPLVKYFAVNTQVNAFPKRIIDFLIVCKFSSVFFSVLVSPNRVTWELMPQKGDVPAAREGHTLW